MYNITLPFRKKVTLIDIIFLLLVIFVGLFLLYYFMRKRVTVYVDLTFQRQDWNQTPFPPEYWELSAVEPGNTSYNSVGKQVAKVVEVEKNIWDGGRRLYIELAVELDAIYNTTTRTYVFDGNPLLIGKELTLQLGNTSFTGIIANVYESQSQRLARYKKANAEITVHYRDYDPWHAEALRNFVVTNSKGEIILKTKEIKITPAEKVVVTDRGDVLLRSDPLKRDVTITFELPNILCLNKLCYYNRYQTFMIGEEFWADSGATYVSGGSVVSSEINYLE